MECGSRGTNVKASELLTARFADNVENNLPTFLAFNNQTFIKVYLAGTIPYSPCLVITTDDRRDGKDQKNDSQRSYRLNEDPSSFRQ